MVQVCRLVGRITGEMEEGKEAITDRNGNDVLQLDQLSPPQQRLTERGAAKVEECPRFGCLEHTPPSQWSWLAAPSQQIPVTSFQGSNGRLQQRSLLVPPNGAGAAQ